MYLIYLGILAGIATAAVGFAWLQARRASKASQVLRMATEDLPARVADAQRLSMRPGLQDALISPAFGKGCHVSVDCLDVNADGQKELIVQHPTGAHGSALSIFGWRVGKFQKLADLGVGTPVGFEFGDFDGDGRIEIRSQETDWSANLPYVTAPRLTLLFRWNGAEFVEISRQMTPAESA